MDTNIIGDSIDAHIFDRQREYYKDEDLELELVNDNELSEAIVAFKKAGFRSK